MKYDIKKAKAFIPFGPNTTLSKPQQFVSYHKAHKEFPESMLMESLWKEMSEEEQREALALLKMDEALE